MPTNAWKRRAFNRDVLHRRALPGRHRPGLRRGHAPPAPQRLRGPGQRRHALSARSSCEHPRQDGDEVEERRARGHPQARHRPQRPAVDADRGSPGRDGAAYLQPRGPADRRGRQVGHRRVRHSGTSRAGCRSTTGSRPSSRRTARRSPATRTAPRRSRARTPTSSSSRSLNDTRTAGNAATEVVKYFLQLHYGLRIDLRQRWVLERANFYGGWPAGAGERPR